MLEWHGHEVSIKIAKEMHKRVKLAGLLVQRVAQHSIRLGGTTKSGYKRKKGEKRYKINTFRSKPGEPPRLQSGELRRSLRTEVEPKTASIEGLVRGYEGRVGTNIVYGRPLEMGTKNMAPRPFLRPAYHRSLRAIQAIFRRPMDRL